MPSGDKASQRRYVSRMINSAAHLTSSAVARFAAGLVMASLLSVAGAAPALAQNQQPPASATDRIDLVGLTTRQPRPDAPSDEVQFQATVNYRLQSVETGTVLLFLF